MGDLGDGAPTVSRIVAAHRSDPAQQFRADRVVTLSMPVVSAPRLWPPSPRGSRPAATVPAPIAARPTAGEGRGPVPGLQRVRDLWRCQVPDNRSWGVVALTTKPLVPALRTRSRSSRDAPPGSANA